MDKSKGNIIDRPLSKGKSEVSLSSFAFMFSELVQYTQARCTQRNINDLETRLAEVGAMVGVRFLDLLVFREKGIKRELRLVPMLSYIQTNLWKALFGRPADSLEKSIAHEDEYMIIENSPLVNKYISMPKEMGALNCAAFVAGIVRGALDSAEFYYSQRQWTEKVTAHTVQSENDPEPARTVIVIKFRPEVIAREQRS